MAVKISTFQYPTYKEASVLWSQMRETRQGEQAVKLQNTKYLPMTAGQLSDYDGGKKNKKSNEALARYNSYKLRAVFPNYVSDTIISMLGVMYAEKPQKIDLPDAMEPMRTNATPHGDSIEMLMRRTNENQLIVGRRGMLLDSTQDGDVPKVIEYSAEAILNWDVKKNTSGDVVLSFVLLDESAYMLQGVKWEWVKKYRLVALDSNDDYYTIELSEDDNFDDINILVPGEKATYPKLREKGLKEIPFVFANATSNIPDIESPPLLALSNISVSIYRGDADYRLHLHQQAQDTLFLKGFDEKELGSITVGAGAFIGATNPEADAKYLGVGSVGLPEERQSLENLNAGAVNMGIALVEQKGVESGEALQTRLAVKTASMKTIALSGARAVEKILKIAAGWMVLNPDDVVIEPNLDFSTSEAASKELVDLYTFKQQGGPISNKSVHEYMKKKDFTEMEFEEEQEEIEGERKVTPQVGE